MNELREKSHAEKRDMASSVLSRIDRESIAPTPRWHYLFHEGVVWGVGAGAVVIGALAVAGIIFTGTYSDWEYYEATHDNLASFALDIVPYTWIITLLLFGLTAYISVRHTKRGYRYSIPILMLGAVGASSFLGTALYGAGAGRYIDEEIGRAIPMHRSLQETKIGFWNQPEMGIISGIVKEITDDGTLTLRTPRGDEMVSITSLEQGIRAEIKVGSALRIMAPRTTTTVVNAVEATSSARTYAKGGGETSITMKQNVDSSSSLSMSTPAEMEMMTTAMDAPETMADEIRELREACLVLPLDWDRGFEKSREERTESGKMAAEATKEKRTHCIKELRELRRSQVIE